MMEKFLNDYILISDNGIDLLRNHFPYRHINYSEIHSTRIYNGYLLQNRLIPLLAGILIIGLSFKLLSPEIEIIKGIPNSSVSYGRGVAWLLLMPLVLMALGSYFLVQSLRKSKILKIETKSGHVNIRIKEFEQANKIQDLVIFLNRKLMRKVEMIL